MNPAGSLGAQSALTTQTPFGAGAKADAVLGAFEALFAQIQGADAGLGSAIGANPGTGGLDAAALGKSANGLVHTLETLLASQGDGAETPSASGQARSLLARLTQGGKIDLADVVADLQDKVATGQVTLPSATSDGGIAEADLSAALATLSQLLADAQVGPAAQSEQTADDAPGAEQITEGDPPADQPVQSAGAEDAPDTLLTEVAGLILALLAQALQQPGVQTNDDEGARTNDIAGVQTNDNAGVQTNDNAGAGDGAQGDILAAAAKPAAGSTADPALKGQTIDQAAPAPQDGQPVAESGAPQSEINVPQALLQQAAAAASTDAPPPPAAPGANPPAAAQVLVQELAGTPGVVQGRVVEPANAREPARGKSDPVKSADAAAPVDLAQSADLPLETPLTALSGAPREDKAPPALAQAGKLEDHTLAPPPADGPDAPAPLLIHTAAAASDSAPAPTQVVATSQTIDQLAAQIAEHAGAKTTRFQVELDPAGLGRVDVRVEINHRGELTAQLSFENPHAAQELRTRAGDLQTALQQAGFDTSRTALHFNSGGQFGHGNLWQGDQNPQGRSQAWSRGAFADLSDASSEAAPPAWARSNRPDGVDVTI